MSTYLGQNFLKDKRVLEKIIDKVDKLLKSLNIEKIVEIGPGRGALTRYLIALNTKFFAIEKDDTLIPILNESFSGVQVFNQDVLEFDINQIEDLEKTLIVGNLPYYITSPILTKFFANPDFFPAGGVFMMQKEVAEKIDQNATKKSYLRRLVNFFYDVKYSFKVGPKSFSPPPKIDSGVVIFTKKNNLDPKKVQNFGKVMVLIDALSGKKRKTLGKIRKMITKTDKTPSTSEFKPLLIKDIVYNLPIHLSSKRIEELSWDDVFQFFE